MDLWIISERRGIKNERGEDHFKDGELDGVSTTWDEDGNKLSEKHYKDGKEEGVATYWYL